MFRTMYNVYTCTMSCMLYIALQPSPGPSEVQPTCNYNYNILISKHIVFPGQTALYLVSLYIYIKTGERERETPVIHVHDTCHGLCCCLYLTGTFLSSWILYCSMNDGLAIRSTYVKNTLARIKTILENSSVTVWCVCVCVCVCVCEGECVCLQCCAQQNMHHHVHVYAGTICNTSSHTLYCHHNTHTTLTQETYQTPTLQSHFRLKVGKLCPKWTRIESLMHPTLVPDALCVCVCVCVCIHCMYIVYYSISYTCELYIHMYIHVYTCTCACT